MARPTAPAGRAAPTGLPGTAGLFAPGGVPAPGGPGGHALGSGGPRPFFELGGRHYDITHRALVMGILNRTPDSFYDKGATWDYDAFWRRAEEVVADGADILDVGAVKAGPGPEVGASEEMDRLLPAVSGLSSRFDLPISVDTWRAAVAAEAYSAGAVMGNDISGFADPDYLPVAAAANASVVATHIRLAPRVHDPEPEYTDLVGEVSDFLLERAVRARSVGIPAERIVLDAGLDLGKTAAQSLHLLRASSHLASLGYPLLLSASNKGFLGSLLGLEVDERTEASLAAHALGITLGCRLVRAHDVRGTRRVADMLAAIMAAAVTDAARTETAGTEVGGTGTGGAGTGGAGTGGL